VPEALGCEVTLITPDWPLQEAKVDTTKTRLKRTLNARLFLPKPRITFITFSQFVYLSVLIK